MKLEYLEETNRDDFLKLFDSEMSYDEWMYFWENYSENTSKVIYCAWILNKELNKDILIGTVSILVENKPYNLSPIIYITDLIVAQKYRHLGIGTLIIKNVLDECKSYYPLGIKILCDEKYQSFYENLDFVRNDICMEFKNND